MFGVSELTNLITKIKNLVATHAGDTSIHMTATEKDKLAGIDDNANHYVLPTASSSALGGIKTGYAATGKNYPLQLDTNGKAYVNVPWTDTDTKYTLGSFGVTATSAELNYTSGVTSNIQTQLNGKSASNHGHSNASASAAGYMSKEDYAKLSAFQAASNYALKTDMTNVYKYKGSVSNEASLPKTGMQTGDVYNIEAISSYGGAGMNVAWTGKAWDSLGEVFAVDVLTNTEIDSICT